MKKIILIAIFSLLVLSILQTPLFSLEEPTGVNPNQPYSPGDWLYRTYVYAQTPGGSARCWTIIYKGIEQNNMVAECIAKDKNDPQGNNVTEPKIFKIPLDADKKTFINLLGDKTYLATVIDEKNRITLIKTDSYKNIPIRFYPELQIGFVAHSKDFDPNRPLVEKQ